MENMNTQEMLHQTLAIVDTNIKKIAQYTPEATIDGQQPDRVNFIINY